MCLGCGYGPPYGIPLEPEVFEQFPSEVKEAFELFDNWLKEAAEKSDGQLISKASMPENVSRAMQIINEAPIPGYEDAKGAESCFMVTADWLLSD